LKFIAFKERDQKKKKKDKHADPTEIHGKTFVDHGRGIKGLLRNPGPSEINSNSARISILIFQSIPKSVLSFRTSLGSTVTYKHK